jgi:hypothetical protein
MAEVIHRYVGKGARSHAELRRKSERAEADRDFVEEKTLQTLRRRQLTKVELASAVASWLPRILSFSKPVFLTAMRQKILQISYSYARQLLKITDAKVMSGKLREMSISILNDIKNLPQQITDPNWLETLEEDALKAKPRR